MKTDLDFPPFFKRFFAATLIFGAAFSISGLLFLVWLVRTLVVAFA